MNDIVERVAKAQNALAVKNGYITAWETLDEEQRSAALELARVAIETTMEVLREVRLRSLGFTISNHIEFADGAVLENFSGGIDTFNEKP